MNEQIIKRLRDAGDRLPLIGDTGTNLHLDAAKEIEKLQAEVEELRTANLDSVAVCEQALQAKTAAEQERDQLKALREGELHHNDDVVAAMFSMAMRKKLAKKRADGRSGWDDKDICSEEFLNKLLCGHIEKGDPVDVANFAMMLWYRNEKTSLAAHDAKVIERFVDGIINFIEEALPEISQHKKILCIRELKFFRDTAIEHGVDSIQNTANQLRQQAKEVQS